MLVAGHAVFLDGKPTDMLGAQRTGSFLRADTTVAPQLATAATAIST